jgi:hypothetical protein
MTVAVIRNKCDWTPPTARLIQPTHSPRNIQFHVTISTVCFGQGDVTASVIIHTSEVKET